MKKLAVLLAIAPLLAAAQSPQKPANPQPAPQAKPAPPPDEATRQRDEAMRQRDEAMRQRDDRMKERELRMKEREERFKERAARREQRAKLARTLGLAEILGLNEGQALKLRDALSNLDARSERAREQLRTSRDTLERAADEDAEKKATAAEVDQAIQRMFAARAELEAIDRDTLAALPKDLSPDKRARAAIFLQRFSSRFGPERMVESRVIRVPGLEGMNGFNFEVPGMHFEMRGVPGADFDPFEGRGDRGEPPERPGEEL